jgi:excisionase family DNA binding protein
MTETNNHEVISEGLERVADAARFLSVSRSLIYKLMDAGLLPSVKIGNSRRIPIRAVRELAADHLIYKSRPDGR